MIKSAFAFERICKFAFNGCKFFLALSHPYQNYFNDIYSNSQFYSHISLQKKNEHSPAFAKAMSRNTMTRVTWFCCDTLFTVTFCKQHNQTTTLTVINCLQFKVRHNTGYEIIRVQVFFVCL